MSQADDASESSSASCEKLQEAFAEYLLRPPFSLPREQVIDKFGASASCPLLAVDPDLSPALTSRGDLCMVAVRSLPAGRLLLREVPLATSRCDSEDSSYNMLLLLATTARNYDRLRQVSYGLMPRGSLPRAEHAGAEVQKVFLQIVDGMREMLEVVRHVQSLDRTVAALRSCFDDLSEQDAKMVAAALVVFCGQHASEEDDAELLRLTVVFLLNSFGSSKDEIRLCRFCALFNHSCEPCAMPEWEGSGDSKQMVGMRLVRSVSAGEEITFAYMPIHQDPTAWQLDRRRSFLLKTFAFKCECSRCLDEETGSRSVPRSVSGEVWSPFHHFRWECGSSDSSREVLIVTVDLSGVWPVTGESLESHILDDILQLRLVLESVSAKSIQAELTLPALGLPCWEADVARLFPKRRQLQLRLEAAEGIQGKR
eukprot:TRINITY_DN10604_c0_g1_i1.p1 TRINITY_DN10604_c0_g1~~TRINITY_DN10604_c0_g1_i1.p1  ORF type:complete len:436 (+),score=79.36 TRINITY_DN10604_c0_g1_i1:33-1310(+)